MKKIFLVLIAAAFVASGPGFSVAQTNKPPPKKAYAVAGDKIVAKKPNNSKPCVGKDCPQTPR